MNRDKVSHETIVYESLLGSNDALIDPSLSAQHDLVMKTIRLLVMDLCEQFGGGHGGYVSFSS
jgi:hypothetical protein